MACPGIPACLIHSLHLALPSLAISQPGQIEERLAVAPRGDSCSEGLLSLPLEMSRTKQPWLAPNPDLASPLTPSWLCLHRTWTASPEWDS